MIDEAGQPVSGEPFDIVTPSGEIEHGITGTDGRAHIELPTDGTCQITFRNLDAAVWEQLS
jgi:hypothetical protein